MRITSKSQVTIPQAIREKAGLLPHTEVEFHYVRAQVVLKPVIMPSVAGEETISPIRADYAVPTRGLVDSNVLIDLLENDPNWADW